MKRWMIWSAIVVGVALGVVGVVYLFGLTAPEEAPEGSSNWAAYIALMGNFPHWALEISVEVVTGILIYPVARRFWDRAKSRGIRDHDEQHHPEDVHDH